MCAEKCVTDYNLTREELDEFALSSYRKAAEAWAVCTPLNSSRPQHLRSTAWHHITLFCGGWGHVLCTHAGWALRQ